MKRAIQSFEQDADLDWRACLECGHAQHVRHKPPFFNRPWVVSEQGREQKIGMELDCVLCDRLELPSGLVAYKRTPEFTQDTVPAGLLKDHSTKSGTWGKICLSHGRLQYVTPQQVFELTCDAPGIVVPNMLHSVKPLGEVAFYVEFFKKARSPD